MTITSGNTLIALQPQYCSLAACVDPSSNGSNGARARPARARPTSRCLPDPHGTKRSPPWSPLSRREASCARRLADYTPAEFLADDLQTAQGYDVDINKAL